MTEKTENDFDRIARVYDSLAFAVFGDTILQAQKVLMAHIPPRSRILFIGGGTGKILPHLLQQDPEQIWYVEKSAKMLAKAKLKVPAIAPVQWILGDETHPAIQSQPFDVILTFFLLDLFEESSLKRLMENLTQNLRPEGKWLVADFNPEASSLYSRLVYKSMYRFFQTISRVQASHLPDYPLIFNKLGYAIQERKVFYSDMIQALVYQK